MATVAQVGALPHYIEGSQKKTVTDVSLDSSYPTGGEQITAANLRLNYIDHAQAQIQEAATTTVNAASASFRVNTGSVSGDLLLYDETPAEVANAADMAGLVVRVTAYGY